MSAATATQKSAIQNPQRSPLFASLIGVVAVIVLFQAVWAGIFIRESKKYNATWVQVHSRGADLAILLTIVAAIVVFIKIRERRDLLIGSITLAVALVLESYIGGLVGNSPWVTAIHFPLAMAIMGLCGWLPLRTRH